MILQKPLIRPDIENAAFEDGLILFPDILCLGFPVGILKSCIKSKWLHHP
jgi:hypothetical protein